MKLTINIARILVGVLFIFSGLVKANDPLGLSYKMQEFFELWGMTKFDSWTLPMSVLMNAFEIIAGFALLLGWRIKLFSWLLLLLIIFFTFLTGYTFITGKPTNCGCFGDCLLISSKTSFLKDLALTIMIAFLFYHRNKIKPLFSQRVGALSMLTITILSFGIQWYSLTYLPLVDCLPFKKGNNISEKMKLPVGSRPDSFAIRFVYEKNGKQFEFSPAGLPSDLATYKFVSRVDKLIKKGNAEPPIKGFALSGTTDQDSTQVVLIQPYAILLFCENFSSKESFRTVPVSKWKPGFSRLYSIAKGKNIPAYLITSQPGEAAGFIKGSSFADIQIFKCDYTAIRTAARTNPCLYLLEKGTVLGKWSYHKTGEVIKKIEGLVLKQDQNEIPKDSIPPPLDTSKIK